MGFNDFLCAMPNLGMRKRKTMFATLLVFHLLFGGKRFLFRGIKEVKTQQHMRLWVVFMLLHIRHIWEPATVSHICVMGLSMPICTSHNRQR